MAYKQRLNDVKCAVAFLDYAVNVPETDLIVFVLGLAKQVT